jgi:predicted ArsR family transcriptional regulator
MAEGAEGVDPHRAVADALARLGFAPREVTGDGDRRAGTSRLSLGNCPFRDAVARPGGHLVCALHRGLVEGVARRADPSATVPEFVARDPIQAGCTVAVAAPRPD